MTKEWRSENKLGYQRAVTTKKTGGLQGTRKGSSNIGAQKGAQGADLKERDVQQKKKDEVSTAVYNIYNKFIVANILAEKGG